MGSGIAWLLLPHRYGACRTYPTRWICLVRLHTPHFARRFWAPWCGYCRALAPALESIEKQYENLLSVGRINFDTETAVARRYNIHKLPTLLLFINGAVAGFLIDPSSEKEIDAFLKKMLGLNVGGLYGKYV